MSTVCSFTFLSLIFPRKETIITPWTISIFTPLLWSFLWICESDNCIFVLKIFGRKIIAYTLAVVLEEGGNCMQTQYSLGLFARSVLLAWCYKHTKVEWDQSGSSWIISQLKFSSRHFWAFVAQAAVNSLSVNWFRKGLHTRSITHFLRK